MTTVTIPTTYNTSDLTVGTGVATGQKVKASALQQLAANHNFIGGNYVPPVANVFRAGGFAVAASGSNFYNAFLIPVKRQVDGRFLSFTGLFTNTSSSAQEVRLTCGSFSSASVSIAAGTTTATAVTLSCNTPNSSNFVAAVQMKTGTEVETCLVHSGSLFWTPYNGTQSALPLTSNFVWAQSDEHAANQPLTVEQVNRFLGGPATAYKAMGSTAGNVVGELNRFAITTTSTTDLFLCSLPVFTRGFKKLIFTTIAHKGIVSVHHGKSVYEVAGTPLNSSMGTTAPSSLYQQDLVLSGTSFQEASLDTYLTTFNIYFRSADTSLSTLGALSLQVVK